MATIDEQFSQNKKMIAKALRKERFSFESTMNTTVFDYYIEFEPYGVEAIVTMGIN